MFGVELPAWAEARTESAELTQVVPTEYRARMRSGTYEYQSEFARKYLAQGRQEEAAEAVLEVLEARGLRVDEQARLRIAACSDVEQLKRWLRRAVSVQSIQELFEPAPQP